MPLCEVQQALKKGQVVEGVLRINPRNYEDSFISAPDNRMDIYIGGLHDRNRALNGDLVAVELKPQHQWKIHWDRVHLWEQQSGKSVLDVLLLEEEEEDKGDELPEEQQPPPAVVPEAPSWDGAQAGLARPSDTIEVLGIERLLGQVQEYVDRRRGAGRVSMPCSLEASLAPHALVEQDEESTPVPLPPKTVGDPWAIGDDGGSTVVFSPEELLEVPEEEIAASCRKQSTRRMTTGCAVAPDELSGEDWFSDGSEAGSTGSCTLDQHLEDMAFLRASQDARNNNDSNAQQESETPTQPTPPTLPVPPVLPVPPDLPVPSALPVPPALPTSPTLPIPKTEARTGKPRGKRGNNNKKKEKQEPTVSSGSTASLRKESQYEHVSVADMLRHPQWKRFVQCTGRVVHILEAKNSRVTAGLLRLQPDRNPAWLLFSPKDSRFPRMLIPGQQAPHGFFERPADFGQTLFLAELTKWLPDSTFAQGQLRRLLGQAGDLRVETEAILESYEVDHGEFPPDILVHLDPSWKVPQEELSRRRDFRNELVFTVDPKTARDLDDALSCRLLEDGSLWEVGVHIADVSLFVLPGTKLDQIALRRATSVYLVQQVIPMLPRLLCDQLCSLHPGEDKLTFSVVWTMTRDGRVLSEWFGRSVIRSCSKLSYEHAQDLMDDPDRQRPEGELPELHGPHTWAQVAQALGVLRDMTRAMRARRFAGGALRLDQVRVAFSLSEDFQPVGFSVYEHTESHRLIEELMLLANMAVAHRIYKAFPEQAFLRSHPPPDDAQLTEVLALCTAHGIPLDTSSAGALQTSLNQLVGSDEASHARLNVLTNLLSRPMKMATYFCAGRRDDPDTFWHYALNVPLYTHFTSPIRRYSDIVVHRLLGAALGYSEPLRHSPKELQAVAEHCNDKKFKARNVQDLSIELFLYVFIQQCGKLEDRAMVTSVQEHAFDVLSLSVGMVKRVYCDKLGVKSFSHSTEGGRNCIELRYQSADGVSEVTDTIGVFKLVDIVIAAMPREPLKYQVVLKPPANTVPVPPNKEDKQYKGKQFNDQKRIQT